MAANNSHTNDGHGILLYSSERVLVYAKHVNLSFKSAPESFFAGKKTGNLYLTSHRILFLATDDGALKSLAMPFVCIGNVQLEQPIFGANYLEGTLTAQPGGNFEGEVVWKLTFNKGGCIDFGRALRQAVSMVQHNRPANAPPAYVPPAGSFYAAPPVYAEVPPQNINGFQAPTHVFTDRPEQGTLFVFDQPPPYSGINDQPGQQHPPMYPNLGNQIPPYPQNPSQNAPVYPSNSTGASAPPLPNYDDATRIPQKS